MSDEASQSSPADAGPVQQPVGRVVDRRKEVSMNPWKEHQRRTKGDDLLAQCQALVNAGKRVEALKLYRQKTGCDFRRAMAELQLKHW